MKELVVSVCAFLFSLTISAQKSERCDTLKHSHYSTGFFSESELHLKGYDWKNTGINCQINRAQKHRTKFTGLMSATGVSLVIGTSLMASGLGWAIAKKEQNYTTGYTLVFAGMGTCAVAVPFFVFADIHSRKANKALRDIRTF